MVGLWVVLGTLAVAVGFGLVSRRRDGRLRPVDPTGLPTVGTVADDTAGMATSSADSAGGGQAGGRDLRGELAALGISGGTTATLLQFSSAFCAPCRTTRVLLADVARIVPGVVHADVDAEGHLELVRRLGVRRTPTVFVLDAGARIVSTASGAPPSRAAVLAAVGATLDAPAAGGSDKL
jgi:thiol-disulfide isomerase/thioredoxin